MIFLFKKVFAKIVNNIPTNYIKEKCEGYQIFKIMIKIIKISFYSIKIQTSNV
jgi:hypothetical protein